MSRRGFWRGLHKCNRISEQIHSPCYQETPVFPTDDSVKGVLLEIKQISEK